MTQTKLPRCGCGVKPTLIPCLPFILAFLLHLLTQGTPDMMNLLKILISKDDDNAGNNMDLCLS